MDIETNQLKSQQVNITRQNKEYNIPGSSSSSLQTILYKVSKA